MLAMLPLGTPVLAILLLGFAASLQAEVTLPKIFGDHMVLQREQQNPVWGKAAPGEKVTVSIADQTKTATADDKGQWMVELDAMQVGKPLTMTVKGQDNTVTFEDVLVGEVWICSGQSNMAFRVSRANAAELEVASANYPDIRLFTVGRKGTQEPQEDVKGNWQACSPETVGDFSAVGYFFGRHLYNTLQIPIGLIDNAWPGSSAEAWVSREVLDQYPQYAEYIEEREKAAREYSDKIHEQKVKEYREALAAWEANSKKGQPPSAPRDPRTYQHRAGNIYYGMLHPTIGYGIRGVIWYQGESNSVRPENYRHLFPLLITSWRDDWGQGDFPFYWVQLADFKAETDDPNESGWAAVREAQTMTLKLPNTGQAVIIDTGEGRDNHPRDKQTVANRLACIALARDYGYDIPYRSATYESMEVKGDKIVITLDLEEGASLYTFDVNEPIGFAIAGEDRNFVWAEAELTGKNQVTVWSEEIPNPVAVRYAWVSNPVCNLYDSNRLPVTPFRTDNWDK